MFKAQPSVNFTKINNNHTKPPKIYTNPYQKYPTCCSHSPYNFSFTVTYKNKIHLTEIQFRCYIRMHTQKHKVGQWTIKTIQYDT